MSYIFRELGRAARCFFDWPQLWTRFYTTLILIFSCHELSGLRVSNSDTHLSTALADGYQWMIMLVLLMYMSKNGASIIMQIAAKRFGIGGQEPEGK